MLWVAYDNFLRTKYFPQEKYSVAYVIINIINNNNNYYWLATIIIIAFHLAYIVFVVILV